MDVWKGDMELFGSIYIVAVKKLIVLSAAVTSRIQSMMLRIGTLQAEKIERLSVILRSLNMVNN